MMKQFILLLPKEMELLKEKGLPIFISISKKKVEWIYKGFTQSFPYKHNIQNLTHAEIEGLRFKDITFVKDIKIG